MRCLWIMFVTAFCFLFLASNVPFSFLSECFCQQTAAQMLSTGLTTRYTDLLKKLSPRSWQHSRLKLTPRKIFSPGNLVPRTFSLAREKVLGTRLPGLKIFLGVNLRRLCCQERGLSFFKRSVYLVVSPVDNICAAVCWQKHSERNEKGTLEARNRKQKAVTNIIHRQRMV